MQSFNINWNLVSAFSMAVSAFFAGAFFARVREAGFVGAFLDLPGTSARTLRKAEFKESLEQIRNEQQAILQRVEEVNAYVKLKEIELISQLDSAYLVMDDLNDQRRRSWRRIEETEKRINIEQSKLRLNVDQLKQEIKQTSIQFISN